MTRFAINGNYLYVLNNSSIQVFTILNTGFSHVRDVNASFGMETIFARGDYLYLGANDGMYIYSIADPASPSFIFRYAHIVSCDPVFVQGDRAYVTLHNSLECNRGVNMLDIIDISNPYNPTLIKSYPMNSPLGLSVENNVLFLCEGEFGFKVFDVSEALDIKLLAELSDFHAYDVIVRQGLITITGEDGIFQYQYNNAGSPELQLLSKIPVDRTEL